MAKKKKKKLNHLQQRQRKERLKKLSQQPIKYKPPKIQSKRKAKTAKQKRARANAIARNPQHGNYSSLNQLVSEVLQGKAKDYEMLLKAELSKIRPEALDRVANGRIYGSKNSYFIYNNEKFQLETADIESAIDVFMDSYFSPFDYKDIDLDRGSSFDDEDREF